MQQELVRRDIITMVIDGERRGQTAKNVLGEDYQAFCDEIIAAVPHASLKRRFLGHLGVLFAVLAFECGCLLLAGLIRGGVDSTLPMLVFSLGTIIQYAIFITLVIVLVRQLTRHVFDMFGRGRWSRRKIVTWVGYGVGLMIASGFSLFFREPVIRIHVLIGVIIFVGVVVIALAIDFLED
ncbi:hypothetical protein [Bifidobacterium eulemuris]|nr:hypothetical protein [Bifidobacterium eulemuris]QOL31855.1 hypothetical protein BE0216_04790 [Bifidobacterium eulemuris]